MSSSRRLPIGLCGRGVRVQRRNLTVRGLRTTTRPLRGRRRGIWLGTWRAPPCPAVARRANSWELGAAHPEPGARRCPAESVRAGLSADRPAGRAAAILDVRCPCHLIRLPGGSPGGSILPIQRIWWLSRPGANNPPGNSLRSRRRPRTSKRHDWKIVWRHVRPSKPPTRTDSCNPAHQLTRRRRVRPACGRGRLLGERGRALQQRRRRHVQRRRRAARRAEPTGVRYGDRRHQRDVSDGHVRRRGRERRRRSDVARCGSRL